MKSNYQHGLHLGQNNYYIGSESTEASLADRIYSTSVQRVMYTLSVQHYNWAKQSVCTSNDKMQ